MTRVAILGAGPAGVGAALGLAERGIPVEVVERLPVVGGNAGSFELAGVRVDFGSHRLHPSTDPAIFARLQTLLGDDLLERPRHGRIRLLGSWIHFPLRPLDLLLRLPPRFAASAAVDTLAKPFLRGSGRGETFASVIERGLGRTMARSFYFPYARKIWGLAPEEIAAAQAHKRVSAGSTGALIRRLLFGRAAGVATRKGTFFYPRNGYGQISEALCEAAQAAGARIALGTTVEGIGRRPGGGFDVQLAGRPPLQADHLWSTIPVARLAQLMDPPAPAAVLEAAAGLELRAMLLVYVVLEQDRFSEYDAHYFPGPEVPFTRVSEPKNYGARTEPRGRTVLCAELPCSRDDAIFARDDAALGELVVEGLGRAGLPVTAPVREVAVRRLPAAYPIYRNGYERHFERLDAWLDGVDRLLTFGRQGLFAHDNTHHALAMADAAVSCLGADGRFDHEAWARHRAVFETHVVED